MKHCKALTTMLILLATFAFSSGCAIERKPMKHPTPVSEVPEGPGVFTGEDGALIITN